MTEHTLYALPFACSFAVHLTLARQEVSFDITWVERGTARQIGTPSFVAVNPKRKVPTLSTPDGEKRTEMVSILHDLLPPTTAHAQRKHLEWLGFLSTEVHYQLLAPLFDPEAPPVANEDRRRRLAPSVLQILEHHLADTPLLGTGPLPSPADAYLLWCLLLLQRAWPETVASPALTAFRTSQLRDPLTLAVVQRERAAMATQMS